MKKKSGQQTRAESVHEIHKLNQSLREQWARMDEAQKLAEGLHEEIRKVEEHVEDGKRKTRRKS